jgi:UDP-N-acetylglucosamine--N-acetylmuramyl-(pentapeptide) pyrophosphoryl-undecaprenol N-acetylglucosamine transferase
VPNPLPRRILRGDASVGTRRFGLCEGRPVVLVLGGSQGASALNRMVFEAGRELANGFGAHAPQFLWLTGDREHADWVARAADPAVPAGVFHPLAFIEGIEHAYAVADLVVSRAGAGTIAELLATGQPSILVPYPHAVGDHQSKNALRVSRGGAAIVVPEAELTAASLARMIGELLTSPSRLRRMSAAAVGLSRPDAADIMADLVLGLVRPRAPRAESEEDSLSPHPAMAIP